MIAGRRIADDEPAYVIAELGHNHGGSLETAREVIRAAAAAGASAVKLQKRDNKTLYTAEAYARPYESENSFGATYGEHREALEFDHSDYLSLQHYVRVRYHNLALFATAFDQQSADFLMELGVPAFKIASNDVINLPLLKYVAKFGRPIIVSTGAASQQDVDRAVNAIYPINPQLALLQCTAVYPCPPELLNLNVITTYSERYPELVIGLSSHFSHPYDVLVACTLGARIFEKHFTMDRASKGTDHAFSLEPGGFAGMVEHLKQAQLMLGNGSKRVFDDEMGAIDKMRKGTRWYQEMYASE